MLYQVYHKLEAEEDLKVAGCWSHCRRRYSDAVKAIGDKEAAKNTTEAAKPQTTESPSGNGGAVSTEAEQTETGVQEMNTSSVNSGGGMEKVGNLLGVLITLLSLALILFLVLLI